MLKNKQTKKPVLKPEFYFLKMCTHSLGTLYTSPSLLTYKMF